VSKRGIDALRDHLIKEGHSGIPTRNDRIFDELQQNNVLIPNGDRSIWKINVAGDDWAHTLTCLCFPVAKIWPDPSSRPDVFNGAIVPADAESETEENHSHDNFRDAEQEEDVAKPSEVDPIQFLPQSSIETPSPQSTDSDQPVSALADIESETSEDADPGQLFRAWLLDGLLKDKFETNSANARIHRVEEGLLLVSPGIFKDYDREDWQRVQRRFQKLKLHRRTAQGTNIYTYQVTGKRNRSRIKGFLIEDPESVFAGVTFPTPNPHLQWVAE